MTRFVAGPKVEKHYMTKTINYELDRAGCIRPPREDSYMPARREASNSYVIFEVIT